MYSSHQCTSMRKNSAGWPLRGPPCRSAQGWPLRGPLRRSARKVGEMWTRSDDLAPLREHQLPDQRAIGPANIYQSLRKCVSARVLFSLKPYLCSTNTTCAGARSHCHFTKTFAWTQCHSRKLHAQIQPHLNYQGTHILDARTRPLCSCVHYVVSGCHTS